MDLRLVELRSSALVPVLAVALGVSGIAGCGGKVEADPPAPPATALPTGAEGARGLTIGSLTKPPPMPPPPSSALAPNVATGVLDPEDAGPPADASASADAGPPVEVP